MDLPPELLRHAHALRGLPDDTLLALEPFLSRGTTTFWDEDTQPGGIRATAMGERYSDLGLIGMGAMGEVRRVKDERLGRVLALKILRNEHLANPRAVSRFVEEAQTAAQLQHPGIVAVHDLGRMPDGRWYFTMDEIRGRSMSQLIREVHRGSPGTLWCASASGWTLQRLAQAFLQVCEAVAFAHERGVVHRDVKPANIMVGKLGEVLVVDWGLAKVAGTDDEVVTHRSAGSLETAHGTVAGTPNYMAPEQAEGLGGVGAPADVWALGAVLYALLCGQPPYVAKTPAEVLAQVVGGPPRRVKKRTRLPLPEDLVQACELAMTHEAENRPGALELADLVRAWLDGTRRREQARITLAQAEGQAPRAEELRRQASELRDEAGQLLAEVPGYAPEESKARGWALEDRATAMERKADLCDLQADALLHAALQQAPELPEVREALLRRWMDTHRDAERSRDGDLAAKAETQLWSHAEALPEGHRLRAEVLDWLAGDGLLSVSAAADKVTLERFVTRNRRLVAEPVRELELPLKEHRLPRGSYRLRIQAKGRAEVLYPVSIERGGHQVAEDIPLPREGSLGADDVYVPAGRFWVGGDPVPTNAARRQQVDVPGFVMRRYPVTNAEYLDFLNDLVASGRARDAAKYVPRERNSEGRVLYGRSGKLYELVEDADGDLWQPDWPVMCVDRDCAMAFAAWTAEKTGLPWRLPGELEWEKAARGVDGRYYPWGDHFDPSWCNNRLAWPQQPRITSVRSFPVDESPYGVRGCSGNVSEWTRTVWSDEPYIELGQAQTGPDTGLLYVNRGGTHNFTNNNTRLAYRFRLEPWYRSEGLGFRLARSWEG